MKTEDQNLKFPVSYCLIILFLGIATSIIFNLGIGIDKLTFHDSVDYLHNTEAWLAGNEYSRDPGTLPFFRAPLYSMFLYLLWSVFTNSIIVIKIAHCVIFGLTTMFVSKLTFRIFNNKIVALLSGAVYALNPFVLMQTTDVQTEPLHTLLIILGVWLLLKADDSKNILLFLLTGICWGLAALGRPSALPIGLVLFGVVFLMNLRKLGFLHSAKILTAVLGLFLAILPWTISNYNKTGEFILINDGGGFNLWYGNQSINTLYDGIKNRQDYDQYNNYGQGQMIADKITHFEQTADYKNMTRKQREKLWQNEALAYMAESPSRTIRIFIQKCWDYWRPYLSPYAYSDRLVIISLIYFSGFYILGIIGGINLFKLDNGKYYLTIFLTLFLASMAIHVLIISMIRYRLPYVEPYLTILAVFGLWIIYQKILSLKNARIKGGQL